MEKKIIRTLTQLPDTGINRLIWELDTKGVPYPSRNKPKSKAEPSGVEVLPGKYTARLTYKKAIRTIDLEVILDPRINMSEEDMLARKTEQERILKRIEAMSKIVTQVTQAKEEISMVNKLLKNVKDTAITSSIKKMTKDLNKQMDSVVNLILLPEDAKGYVYEDHLLNNKVDYLSFYLSSKMGKPNATHQQAMDLNKKELQSAIDFFNTFFEKDWKAYQEAVGKAELSPFGKVEKVGME